MEKNVKTQKVIESWNIEQAVNDIRSLKIKVRSAKNFREAFEISKKVVDERHGLIAICGSQAILSEYWQHKGIKKV